MLKQEVILATHTYVVERLSPLTNRDEFGGRLYRVDMAYNKIMVWKPFYAHARGCALFGNKTQ